MKTSTNLFSAQSRRFLARGWRLLQKIAVAGSVILGIVLLAGSWVHAKVRSKLGDEGLQLGRSLFESLRQGSATDLGPLSRHEISFNGTQVHVESFTLHGKPDLLITEVLDAVREECRTPREDAESVELAPREEQGLREIGFDGTTPLFGNVIIEGANGLEQAVYCFKPAHPLHFRGIATMARNFELSRDLNDLGNWHGVYAKSGPGSATFLTLEGQGSFKPEVMFPQSGDAPGQDFRELPRPSGRRTLSIAHEGITALNTYCGPRSLAESLDLYQQELRTFPVRVDRPAHNGIPGNALFVRSGTNSYIVSGIREESGSMLVVASLPD